MALLKWQERAIVHVQMWLGGLPQGCGGSASADVRSLANVRNELNRGRDHAYLIMDAVRCGDRVNCNRLLNEFRALAGEKGGA